MNAEPEQPQPAPPRRRWLRRAGWTVLGCVLVFVIFHRPILRTVVRVVAVKVAAKQNIHLALNVGGTVLTSLSLENVEAGPTGSGPSPVEKIRIESVLIRYDIASLIRRGPREFIKSYELRNADIVVQPVQGTKSQKHDLGKTLSGILQQPALFSDHVDVRNLNVVAHVPEGEFALKGVNIYLDSVQPGKVEIARLQIPKIRTWENVRAPATYTNRDLTLHGLKLDEDLQFDVLELDASRRSEDINRLFAKGTLFGSHTEMSLFSHQISKTKAEMNATVRTANLSLERLARYMGAGTPPTGTLGDFSLDMSGDPNTPVSWHIDAGGVVENFATGAASVDQAATKLTVRDGRMDLSTELTRGRNTVSLQAGGKLPADVADMVRTEFDGTLKVEAPELSRFGPKFDGVVHADGHFGLHNQTFALTLETSAKDLSTGNVGVILAGATIEATKRIEKVGPQQEPPAPLAGVQAKIAATFHDLHAAKYALDTGTVAISIENERINVGRAEFKRGENTMEASGTYDVPRDPKRWAEALLDCQFAVHAPNANAFNAETDLTGINAQIEATGHVTHDAGGYGGKINATASGMSFRDFTAERAALDVTLSKDTANIETLSLVVNDTDGINGSGKVGMESPRAYDGTLKANIRDLSKFNAFVPNLKGGLAGSVTLDWTGRGEIEPIHHSGAVQLKVADARGGEVQQINAEIAGTYSPETIDIPTLKISTNKGDLAAVIGLKNNQLDIRDILVEKEKATLLTGSITLPIDLRTPAQRETLLPSAGVVAANLEAGPIDLQTLFPQKPPPITGTAKATITGSGTIESPNIRLVLDARELRAAAAAKLAPTAVTLDATLANDQITLNGRVEQPEISPVEIAGKLPFPVREVIAHGKPDDQSPVQLAIHLPESSVAFLSKVVPALRYVEGRMSANIEANGTIAKPVLSGEAHVDMPAIRFSKQDMPAINGFRGDLHFSGNQLNIERFGGNISGGPFNLTGTVAFPKLTEPALDLQLTSAAALLVRNETLTVRADSKIGIAGPFDKAAVTGAVGLTQSRFFREIEILPIELPGRPAPKPPETTPGFSIPNPPLKDWTLNVAITTKDPFMVRGNLANGQVLLDLKLVGTGEKPALVGTATIQNFVASLPFSKLEVNDSHVYFSEDDPFVPKLDIHGTSSMRDTDISVYIYGTASAPQTILSSEPPLPQEDIISLLATGTTASELTGSADVLAGRAAVLLAQRLYRGVFKKKGPPAENESMLSRFNVDVGGVDPRTGQQEVSARFKVAPKFYMIGDLDVQGNVRGQVKYLLRFR